MRVAVCYTVSMTQHTPPTAYSISARYGLHRSLSPLGLQQDGCRHYILWGESIYTRGGHGRIDFEGGPFVSTGEFLNPDAPQPVYLVDCIGVLPCVGANEVVVEARWMEPADAAYALGESVEFLNPHGNRAFALVKTTV